MMKKCRVGLKNLGLEIFPCQKRCQNSLKALVEINSNQTVIIIIAEKYCQYIEEMHEKSKIIRPSLFNWHDPILLYNNV